MADEVTTERVLKDFKRAYQHKRLWLNSAQEDIEYRWGKQWKDEDIQTLREQAVEPLTINKLHPTIMLLLGIESQNRTDFTAFPEGDEDSVISDAVTKLIKNVVKTSGVEYKVSQQFEEALACGEGFIEPYLDFTYDLLYGELKFKKLDYNQIFPEPGSREYDMSDAAYVCKITYDLSKEQLLSLFPDKEKQIDDLKDGKINLDTIGVERIGGSELQRKGYPVDERGGNETDLPDEPRYDLLEYYYKKYVPVYYVLDMKLGTVKQTQDKKEADAYQAAATTDEPDKQKTVKVVRRMVPEIWVKSLVGNSQEELDDRMAWFFPNWKGWHFIPNYCFWTSAPLKESNRDLAVQGIVRQLKDSQKEHNKRRTQELRHLNQSANSGWLEEEDSWVNFDEVKKFGASPGVHLEYKKGKPPPQRLTPVPLSEGHTILAKEHMQDMKEISGINADLLAMEEGGQASGRAISLRQRQGLVMVQKIFDNLSQTKWILGKFILSQLGQVFDVERAIRVLGKGFIQDNFSKPIMMPVADPATGRPAVDPASGQPVTRPAMGPDGQPMTEIDVPAAKQFINQILHDSSIGKFDVAIGESAMNDTVRYANYSLLLEMAGKGIPIPPDVLVEESTLSASSKKRIKMEMQQQQAAMMPPAPLPQKK